MKFLIARRAFFRIYLILLLLIALYWFASEPLSSASPVNILDDDERKALETIAAGLDNDRNYRLWGLQFRGINKLFLNRDNLAKEEEELFYRAEQARFPWLANRTSISLSEASKGFGIVMTGNNEQILFLLSSIRMIREVHNSSIPIEVHFMGESDLSKSNQEKLAVLQSVTIVDLSLLFDLHLKGFQMKAFSILASTFEIALFLDADAILFKNPEHFLTQKKFNETGALFFRDRTIRDGGRDPQRAMIIAIELAGEMTETMEDMNYFKGLSNYQLESGSIIIDRKKHIVAILTICFLNTGTAKEELYQVTYGDKETFWMGFEALGVKYAFNRHLPGALGLNSETVENRRAKICCMQILHFDEAGEPFWFNGSLRRLKWQPDVLDIEIWTKQNPDQSFFWEHDVMCLIAPRPIFFSPSEKEIFQKSMTIFKHTEANLD